MIENINEKLEGSLPITINELIKLISSWGRDSSVNYKSIYQCEAKECYPLDKLDVSQIDDLSYIFYGSFFTGDISNWDVSNAINMENMFYHAKFNGNISSWNTSKVTNMSDMFYDSLYNGDLSKWDVSKVENFEWMFGHSKFNNNSISNWNIINSKFMKYMFYNTEFNGDISSWNISNVIDMDGMFEQAKFNGDTNEFLKVLVYFKKFLNKLRNLFKQCGLNFVITCNYNSSDRQNYQTIMFDNKVLIRINKSKLTYFYSKWKFNNQDCNCIFRFNENFKNKYIDDYFKINTNPPLNSKDFIKWFHENKLKIGNMNVTKEETLDIDDYLSGFNKNDLNISK